MKILKKILMIILLVILVAAVGIYLFMQTAVFGAHPSGDRQARIEKSPNYKNGAFQNLTPTPVQSENFSAWKVMWKYFNTPKSSEPSQPLPSVRTDLKNIQSDKPVVVWFGHSSYFIQINGKKILVDPVFSGNASPVSFLTSNFQGSNVYGVNDFPDLDMVLITHDHYDHLDYKTILELKDKTKLFCTSLGVGAHLEHWGIAPDKIVELDWWESKTIFESMELTATPARHFSGRSFARYKSLWSSFVLKTPTHNLFLGGDSGYETHFKTIGEKFGPFDIALLECGQYNENWPYIHMMPEQTVQASIDLKAEVLMPVHWAKFKLSLHPWKEPIERATKAAYAKGVTYTTPLIGQPVIVGESYPREAWWTKVD
ncbi:MAG: MBL fold metallo-hydrolase [Cyclobacteriaceae bacterium]|nr:MBL fold metallo-hydrolase [Cyclobacteriaceae bacterium]